MDKELNSRRATLQPGAGTRPLAPYSLRPATIGLWLRRGEQLGRAVRCTAMAIAALPVRVSKWRQHVALNAPADPPPSR